MRVFNFDDSSIREILGRQKIYFLEDFKRSEIEKIIPDSSFLVIGGGGSIGSETVKEIFRYSPRILHVIDINENSLAELVRDIRSSLGYIRGEFKTFVIDCGSDIFDIFFENSVDYDYILNFSALKHVRSEKDPFTLMRMMEVNILNTVKNLELISSKQKGKYFCVSTDKATRPVNMMGASKRIMELFLLRYSDRVKISTARFANVAFSDGSLLHSFLHRIFKGEPIVFPEKIKRYFITPKESAYICLISVTMGENREIFFPKLDPKTDLYDFSEIVERFLKFFDYRPYFCNSEEEARKLSSVLPKEGKWPCYISPTDTTGEKETEEFYTENDTVERNRFEDIGIIKLNFSCSFDNLDLFIEKIMKIRKKRIWTKQEIVELFREILPDFEHQEKGKCLDDKM